MLKEVLRKIQEISKEPVEFKKEEDTYIFYIDNRKYVVEFIKRINEINAYEILFYVNKNDDMLFVLMNDNNKPLVVKNTILKIIEDFTKNNIVEVLGFKGDISEPSRVRKYKRYIIDLSKILNFKIISQFPLKNYYRFLLFKNKEVYDFFKNNKEEVIKEFEIKS